MCGSPICSFATSKCPRTPRLAAAYLPSIPKQCDPCPGARGKDYRCLSSVFSVPVVLPSGQQRQKKKKKKKGGLTSMTVQVPSQEESADSYWRGSGFGSRKGLGGSQTPQRGCSLFVGLWIWGRKILNRFLFCFWMLFFYLETEPEDAPFRGLWQSNK